MPRTAPPEYFDALFVRDRLGGLWHRWDAEPRQPTNTSTVTLDVVVNDGRWIVCCPCGGAQMVTGGQDRFFCVDCLNEAQGGSWVRVRWPKDHARIDAVLAKRPTAHQHWEPGETVRDLVADNREHGIKGDD